MGLSAPVSVLRKWWAFLKAMKRKLGLQDFPVNHTSLCTKPMMCPGVRLSLCLAIQIPNTCQVTQLFSFKESCLQSPSSSYALLLLLRGITDSPLLAMTHVRWANCTNAASVLCSACGSSSTLLCSLLTAGLLSHLLGSQRCIQIPCFLPLTLQLNC